MPTPTKPLDVLLIAGIDALGLARFPFLLHKAGCKVTVLAPPGLAITCSRYVDKHLPTSTEPKARALLIIELLSQQPSYDMVIVGDEPSLIALSEFAGDGCLDGWFPVDHRSSSQVQVILSKWDFQQAAIKAGLYTPLAKMCGDWQAVTAATADIGYPIMLKSFSGLSGSGVRKVNNDQELKAAYDDLAVSPQPVLVQRFYEGKLGSTDVLFDHGVPLCWHSSYSLHCWPTPLAASSARELTDHADVAAMVAGVGKMTGFHGFAGIDWIHDTKTNHLYALELNPRVTPSYHLGHYAGVDFSHSLQQLLAGKPMTTEPKPIPQSGVVVNLFPQSLFWAFSHCNGYSFFHCWLDAPWHDPLLMLAYLRRVLTHYLPMHWRQWAKRQLRRG
ncbi:MAG: ATP-grasp domain-containing protein [Methylococcales bacterium]|nr:ATP-grasp domain-containing protein [Methylococcales bacterium]